MEKILSVIPKDLPPWAFIVLVLILVVGFIFIAKLTGNHNKQNLTHFKHKV